MKAKMIETSFLDFFKEHGYIKKDEFTLIPKNDESLLFTNSGMVQFKDIFLGKEISRHDKITTSQTCIRVGGKHNDLDNIGKTPHHNTSFTMLGNFCFKNASKQKAIELAWTFLIKKINLNKEKLYITVHKDDNETFKIWTNIIKIKNDHIILGDDISNFWSMDENGPCGYCSEIFYNIEEKKQNLLEIWNLVFMEFNKHNGEMEKLKNLAIDTGMGLERIVSIKQNVFDSFKTDIFIPLINIILKKFNIKNDNHNVRIIADHLKTCILLMKSSLMPSNYGRGYILKKLIRKAVIKKNELKVKVKLSILTDDFVNHIYSDNLKAQVDLNIIKHVLDLEEEKLDHVLRNGLKLIEDTIKKNKIITGEMIFMLYDTYGIPLDLINDITQKYNVNLDLKTFYLEMDKQIARSKRKVINIGFDKNIHDISKTKFNGYDNESTKAKIVKILIDHDVHNQIKCGDKGVIVTDSTCFYAEKGGQTGDAGTIRIDKNIFEVINVKELSGVYLHYGKMIYGTLQYEDTVEMKINVENRAYISINHSATHLLHASLKQLLGMHVKQAGSFINNKYLRFDFTYFKALSINEICNVENLVNKYIRNSLSRKITYETNDVEKNRVVSFGDNVSTEFCAGTHIENTSEIGLFKIVKEFGIGTNIRRIEAITSIEITSLLNIQNKLLDKLSVKLNVDKKNILNKTEKLIEKQDALEKANENLIVCDIRNELENNVNIKYVCEIKILALKKDKKYVTFIKNFIKNSRRIIIVIFYYEKNNMYININTTIDINAKNIMNYLKTQIKIKGGGTHNKVNGIICRNNKNIKTILEYVHLYIYKTYK